MIRVIMMTKMMVIEQLMMIAINDDVDKCDDVNNDDDESEKARRWRWEIKSAWNDCLVQVIHGAGFNEDERLSFVQDIYKNIFEAMEVLTQRMER